ncbi:MAG TPA: molecular chaperone HtpG [Syntrophomonas sp.]|jgi:molecular chaperone HtpG|nr:molecular chaperone HtpG [Syntrophomonas sp.]
MEKIQFKTESKRLLDLMINSVYTNREIFLRELISNASDAIDKLYFRSLTDQQVGMQREDFAIHISLDKDNRILTISDNGIGMNAEELESNLGTIANSGSLAFMQETEGAVEDVDIIGQFGVGFYSAFMVSKRVTVLTRRFGEEEALQWESEGLDGYVINKADRPGVGTDIILALKDNSDTDNYDEFLEEYKIRSIVKKYSDYIRYPIRMEVEKRRAVEGKEDEFESYFETETLNSMIPIWRKNKSELSDEDYDYFYKEKFFDFENPLRVIHSKTEGKATYNALLFIPARVPYNYYSKEYEKGLQLYSNGVLIMDKCADLLPDHFSFVRGLVDSSDLSLNISREMLQHDRQLKLIASNLEKKIKNELLDMLNNQRETYEKFYENFGLQLKWGIYREFGLNREMLLPLLMFHSSKEKKLVTMSEYFERMQPEQKYIYYASGENVDRIDRLPQTELLKDKDLEILYLTDEIDEFALKILRVYEDKEFKSVSSGDLGLEDEGDDQSAQEQSQEYQPLLDFMKEALSGKVKAVRLSQRLKSHPVCLSSEGMVSLEMEKILNSMPTDREVKAERILEINSCHPIFQTLQKLHTEDQDRLKLYTEVIYNQALLIEGLNIEDPVAFSNAVCDIMAG